MSEQPIDKKEEGDTPTPADEALSASLLTVQVIDALQQDH